MPIVVLDRMPLPSLKTYTSVSVLLVACVCYFAHHTVLRLNDPNSPDNIAVEESSTESSETTEPQQTWKEFENPTRNESLTVEEYLMDFAAVILQEPWCVWVMINMAYCCLILYGKLIQRVMFGQLRVSEQEHLKDKFWNFLFYKFIFIFGVMNVQTMEEVVLWCAWFTVLGCLSLLQQLSKDRFEYLCSSPSTPAFTHVKLLTLLVGVVLSCLLLLLVCAGVGFFFASINTFAFMTAECILLLLKTLFVIVRYVIQLWDETRDGVWENRAVYVYYTELIFELAVLSIDFMHHLHMLVWSNILLSMASLVICMQLRYLFYEFKRRVRRHNNYKRVVKHMTDKFPMASREELATLDDPCAICWERMENARKLPCNHFFHNSCLRSWLEQDTTCPTCRTSFGESPLAGNRPRPAPPGPAGDAPEAQAPPPPQPQLRNHFFHFDGSRYVSWLPSFSVEVRHSQMLSGHPLLRNMQHSQLDNMARQVREVFPDAPLDAVMEDLQRTRSVQGTLENIIEGVIPQGPLHSAVDNDSEFPSPSAPTTSQNADVTTTTQPSVTSSQTTSPTTASSPHSTSASSSLYQPIPSPSDGPSSTSDLYPSYGSAVVAGGDGMEAYMEQAQRPVSWQDGVHEWRDRLNVADNSAAAEESTDHLSRNVAPQGGSRFSKSVREREVMLRHRRKQLLEQARKNFIQKAPAEPQSDSLSSSSSCSGDTSSEPSPRDGAPTMEPLDLQNAPEDEALVSEPSDPQARRELLYEATRRRLSPM